MSTTGPTQHFIPMSPEKREQSRDIAEQIAALLAFHRETFGGYRMEDDGGSSDGDQGADTTDSSDDGDQGDKSTTTDGASTSGDLGFPQNTPVKDMTLEQQVAYHRHQSRKHEQRATQYREAAGGKSAEELRTERENAERERMSEQERAVEDARREAREQATREAGADSVRAAFELALRALPEQERNDFIEDLNLGKFLTDSGKVDTAKVLTRAEKIAPADKDKGARRLDFGGGQRGTSNSNTSGVSAGAAMHAARHNKSAS